MRRNVLWLMVLCSVLPGVVGAMPVQADGRIDFTAAAGRLTAVGADGRVVWIMPMADGRVPTWTVRAGQQIELDNGMVLDAQGRIVKRLHGRESDGRDGDLTLTTDEAAWDPPVELSRGPLPFSPPPDRQPGQWLGISQRWGVPVRGAVKRS